MMCRKYQRKTRRMKWKLRKWNKETFDVEFKLRRSLEISSTPELGYDQDMLDPDFEKNPTLFAASTTPEEKQIPKLKKLPSHLEYAFLDGKPEFSVFISSLLSKQEKKLLLQVLTKHKTTLAWKVAGIKGISPSFFTHKILMEDNYKPIVQPQRRLNPKDEPYPFKSCSDGIIRRCVFGKELHEILEHCHTGPVGGHYGVYITARKVFQAGFYWPTIFKDVARNEWVNKLDDTLWAFRTAYKTPSGSTPSMIVHGKAYHLPVEMEHGAFWALKKMQILIYNAEKIRFLQLNKLVEIRNEAYEHSREYKERMKMWHNARIQDKEFREGREVLVFNSRLKLLPDKLKTRWYGPYMMSRVFPYGNVEVFGKDRICFKVNRHRLLQQKEKGKTSPQLKVKWKYRLQTITIA
ncbi:hypothetical protein Tco_1244619 [Tanacetum coccineum]